MRNHLCGGAGNQCREQLNRVLSDFHNTTWCRGTVRKKKLPSPVPTTAMLHANSNSTGSPVCTRLPQTARCQYLCTIHSISALKNSFSDKCEAQTGNAPSWSGIQSWTRKRVSGSNWTLLPSKYLSILDSELSVARGLSSKPQTQ